MDIIPQKRCTKCKREYPASLEYFYKHKSGKYGLHPQCRACCPGTIATNVLPLCHGIDGCNNYKHARDPVEWVTTHFGKRKAKQILKRIQDYFDSL